MFSPAVLLLQRDSQSQPNAPEGWARSRCAGLGRRRWDWPQCSAQVNKRDNQTISAGWGQEPLAGSWSTQVCRLLDTWVR